MLQLRPSCQCCDLDLPPDSTEARICSFECTFCSTCADSVLGGTCPNCGGELLPRPRRPASKLASYPASVDRVFKSAGCSGALKARRLSDPASGFPDTDPAARRFP